MSRPIDRRTFTAASAVLTASAAASAAPSNQVPLGIIGTGNRGQPLITAFKPHADTKFGAACDLYAQYRDKAKEMIGPDLEVVDDFRKFVERKDLDVIS